MKIKLVDSEIEHLKLTIEHIDAQIKDFQRMKDKFKNELLELENVQKKLAGMKE